MRPTTITGTSTTRFTAAAAATLCPSPKSEPATICVVERIDHAAAHVEGVDAGRHQLGRHALRVLERAAAGHALVAREAQREREIGAKLAA